MASMVSPDETIEVPGVGGRKPRTVLRKLLAEIIEPRIEEIFSLVSREVVTSGYQDLVASGIVLTGGASILEGMPELAEFIFDMPVKRGVPLGLGGLKDVVNSPKFATAVGLLRYMANKTAGRTKNSGRMFAKFQSGKVQAREKSMSGNVTEGFTGAYDKVRTSMKGWIKDLF